MAGTILFYYSNYPIPSQQDSDQLLKNVLYYCKDIRFFRKVSKNYLQVKELQNT